MLLSAFVLAMAESSERGCGFEGSCGIVSFAKLIAIIKPAGEPHEFIFGNLGVRSKTLKIGRANRISRVLCQRKLEVAKRPVILRASAGTRGSCLRSDRRFAFARIQFCRSRRRFCRNLTRTRRTGYSDFRQADYARDGYAKRCEQDTARPKTLPYVIASIH